MKTEYRIIPEKTFIGEMYLQFKTVSTKERFFKPPIEVEEWRFVPKEGQLLFIGRYLNQTDCPTEIPLMQEGNFMHSFYEQESYELIPFTLKYPDIEIYFEQMRNKRTVYLSDKKRKEESAKVIYLK